MKTTARNALALSLATALAASPAYASCQGDVASEAAMDAAIMGGAACISAVAFGTLATVLTFGVMAAPAAATTAGLCTASAATVGGAAAIGAAKGGYDAYNSSPDCSPHR